MYTVREAQTFAEYTQSIYMFSVATVVTVAFVIILLNVTKLFNLIDEYEHFVNTSEKNAISLLTSIQIKLVHKEKKNMIFQL